MAYQVDKFNGSFLTSVDDGTIDNTTDLRLVGKNYAGYGELQNENFVHILENFANTTPPPKVITGQIWYDSGNKKLKFFDGSRFKIASGAEVGNLAPTGMQAGEFWFDTNTEQLYTWNGLEFVLIGPESPPEFGASGAFASIVKDTNGISRAIVKLQSEDNVVAIVSGTTDAFTLDNSINPIPGFSQIKRGFTLVNTDASTGVTFDDHFFWGTSSNALKLGGFSAADFIKAGDISFGEQVAFNDSGYTVGDQNDLKVNVVNGDEVLIENQLGNPITFRIRLSPSDLRDVVSMTSTGLVPGIGDFFSLGTSVNKWSVVHASSINGNLTGNVVGNTTGTHKGDIQASDNTVSFDANSKTFFGNLGSPSVISTMYGNLTGSVTGTATNSLALNGASGSTSSVPNTIVIRDSNSGIAAARLIGTADRATRLRVDNTATDTDPNFASAKTIAAASSIAARDSSGNLTATIFNGTATAARYADLAEKYLADVDYEIGTVVCVGGEKEVTACFRTDKAIGVVSGNPAFMMNSELAGGTYIALKGRVPVRVIGAVNKGEKLVTADNGCASATTGQTLGVFAIALESNSDEGIKIVEALVL